VVYKVKRIHEQEQPCSIHGVQFLLIILLAIRKKI